MSFGWCGPSIPALLSTESPLRTGPITKDESSWISSIFCIGLALGALFSGPMITRWGRIRLLTAMGPAQIAGWLLITFAQNVYYLYCSRFVMGFLGSAMFVVIPVFVAEIAHDRCVNRRIFAIKFRSFVLLCLIVFAACWAPYCRLLRTLAYF